MLLCRRTLSRTTDARMTQQNDKLIETLLIIAFIKMTNCKMILSRMTITVWSHAE
jgi:hypothetical protein